MQLTLRPKELTELLIAAFAKKLKVLIKGAPGIGKTDIVKAACAAIGASVIFMHPAVSDPTDFKGMPAVTDNGTAAHFLPFGDLQALIDATALTIAFIDDIGQAPHAVQAALMQLLQERRVNGHKISDHVVFCGATNDTKHKAGVQGLLEPVKSRWHTIVELVPTVEDWCAWASGPGDMPPELVGFIKFKPDMLNKWVATRELTNSPCPRTVSAVGDWVKAGVTTHAVLAGAAGEAFAIEFAAFLRLYKSLPTVESILANPTHALLPNEIATQCAISSALIRRFDAKNSPAIFTYAARMTKEAEVCLVRDALRAKKEIATFPGFTRWMEQNAEVFQ